MTKTSITNEHSHNWELKDTFTSEDHGHKHEINLKDRVTLVAGDNPHTHRLL